jgi:hypothetical protein
MLPSRHVARLLELLRLSLVVVEGEMAEARLPVARIARPTLDGSRLGTETPVQGR